MDNYNYPVGSDTPEAPWNQKELPEREIEVTVSVTMSTTTKIKVSDYCVKDAGTDEDGNFYEDIDYSDCDLKGAVEKQVFLPHIALKHIIVPECVRANTNWVVDDFEVIKE